MWKELNRTSLGAYCMPENRTASNQWTCVPDPMYRARSPKAMLGNCDAECAAAYYAKLNASKTDYPICGVPGC